jgi:hypothetical protein
MQLWQNSSNFIADITTQTHVFLTSAVVGDDWSASRPGHFTVEKEPPLSHTPSEGIA